MESSLRHNSIDERRVTFPCIVLCVLLFTILGVIYAVPSMISALFRPAFIGVCIAFIPTSRYYRPRALWFNFINLLYYTCIFFFFPINGSTTTTYISMFLFIWFLFFAGAREWTAKEIVWILKALSIGGAVLAIIIFISGNDLFGDNGASHLYFFSKDTNRNPIAFAIAPAVISSLFILLFTKTSHFFKNSIYFVCFLVSAIAVIGIACRSAFMSAFSGVVLLLWEKTKEEHNRDRRRQLRAFILVILILLFLALSSVAKDSYSARLFSLSSLTDDSGRDVLWEDAWETIATKPIFGGGFDYWTSTGHRMGTHNYFLTIMVASGWVGGILLGLFFFSVLVENVKCGSLVPMAFFMEAAFHSWTEPGMDYYAYIPLILCFIFLNYIKYKDKDLIRLARYM